jgi:hypothetical protein
MATPTKSFQGNRDTDKFTFALTHGEFGAPVAFTRYLYEKTEVMHSLLFALLDRKREEALFWAYELYYSGCVDELAGWILWIYDTFYSSVDIWFRVFMELNLTRLMTIPDEIDRDCMVGTIISNFAHRHYDTQYFAKEYMKIEFKETPPIVNNHRIYIHFRPRDLYQYQTVECPPAKLLSTVTKYHIRKSESLFLQRYVYSSFESPTFVDTAQPYLYNWLYYATKCPIWKERVSEYSSAQINDEKQKVIFGDEDEYVNFCEKYGGVYPEEQCTEIHNAHGVNIDKPVQPLCPHEFLFSYMPNPTGQYAKK